MCALFQALTDVFTKKYAEGMSDAHLTLARFVFALPVLWGLSLIEGIPVVDKRIVFVYVAAAPLDILASFLYVRALRVSPISVTVPFLSFTPGFLIVTSFLILGEQPGPFGILGILMIVAGSYVLNISDGNKGIFYPFARILKEKGSCLMLLVAFIYSITSNFGKMGVTYSSPVFFAATYYTILSLMVLPMTLRDTAIRGLFKPKLLYIGVCSALMIFFHFTAIKLTYVSYMISVKRTSLLFGIAFGVLIFKEKGFKEKLTGGVIMILGILFIAFLGK